MDVILAIILITVGSSIIEWLFYRSTMAHVFVNQHLSAEMLRQPKPGVTEEQHQTSQTGARFLTSLLFAVLFVIFWTVFNPIAPPWVLGALAWFVILVPYILFETIYLDFHPRYVTRQAVAWLLRLAFAGVIVGCIF